MKETLAEKFTRWRVTVEAAETPFAKLAIFILPIIAPIVPALFTAIHVYKMLLDLFAGIPQGVAIGLAGIVALVLELLGYVGAITFIQSLYEWLKTRDSDQYLVPVVLNFFAYAFYLIIMFLANYQLGIYFKTPEVMNTIIGILSFMTVPTSLLAANHLTRRQEEEKEQKNLELENSREERDRLEQEKIRKEQAEFKLKAKALKQGINVFQQPAMVTNEQAVPQVEVREPKVKKASDYKEPIWEYLDQQYAKGSVPGVKQITERFKLPYDKAKGFVSTQRTLWAKNRGVDPVLLRNPERSRTE